MSSCPVTKVYGIFSSRALPSTPGQYTRVMPGVYCFIPEPGVLVSFMWLWKHFLLMYFNFSILLLPVYSVSLNGVKVREKHPLALPGISCVGYLTHCLLRKPDTVPVSSSWSPQSIDKQRTCVFFPLKIFQYKLSLVNVRILKGNIPSLSAVYISETWHISYVTGDAITKTAYDTRLFICYIHKDYRCISSIISFS